MTTLQDTTKKSTQLDWIRERLLETGEISRNQCLRQYISRLGARIWDLKKEGYDFEEERRGGDYVYKIRFKETLF